MRDYTQARLTYQYDAEELAPNVCATCQQACEKMLKAYLLGRGWELDRTHDLAALGEEAAKSLPAICHWLSRLADVNARFLPSRYPYDFAPEIKVSDAKQAIETMEALEELLRKQVLGD